MLIVPSIASANQLDLFNEISRVKSCGRLHLDIEDGNFTPNITFGMKMVRQIAAQFPELELDAHLMAVNPDRYLDDLAGCGVRKVTAHIEALPYPMAFINRARKLGLSAGLAMNIKTRESDVATFFGLIDHVLVMTAEPDNDGELLFEPALEKALGLARTLPPHARLFADGGLTRASIGRLRAAGAAGAVLGRLIFQAEDPCRELIDLDNTTETDNEA